MTTTNDVLQISLVAANAASGCSRTFIAPWLNKWNYMEISDDVLLVATELITNATAAAPGGQIRLRLSREDAGVRLAIWDSADELPKPRESPELTLESLDALDLSTADWDAGGGWGLPIVAALTISHGCNPDPRGGKWVWRYSPRTTRHLATTTACDRDLTSRGGRQVVACGGSTRGDHIGPPPKPISLPSGSR
jgi:anti-sigma regulatory factor (Ser/Thr protein kinase)